MVAPAAPITVAPPQGGGNALPGVRDIQPFDPDLQAQTLATIQQLLAQGGFSNLGTQKAILRGETANTLRDRNFGFNDNLAARGIVGSGVAQAGQDLFRRNALTDRLKGLTDLETRSQTFGLQSQQVGLGASAQQSGLALQLQQLGITRDLGLRDQDLRNLISKRMASVQRYGIDVNRQIAADELKFRREGLAQTIIEQNRRFGLDTTQQELDNAYKLAGLAENTRQFDVSAGFETQRIEELVRSGNVQEAMAAMQIQLQEWLQTIFAGQLPSFGPTPPGPGPAPASPDAAAGLGGGPGTIPSPFG